MDRTKKHHRNSVVKNNYLEKLKEAVSLFLKDEEVKVVLFGSRARGDAETTSDIDLGILPGNGFDELNIPYKVEIVDFSTVSAEFKKITLQEAEVWKD